MPIWTCPRCGQKIENFGWGKPPWKSHSCAVSMPAKDIPEASAVTADATVAAITAPPAAVPAPAAIEPAVQSLEPERQSTQNPVSFFQKAKKSNLSGFL
jgi:hypothetical protein